MTDKLKLASPWSTYQSELAKMFENDKDIEVSEIQDGRGAHKHVAVVVRNHKKCMALSQILKDSVIFGNIVLHIDLYDAENQEIDDYETEAELFRQAFEGNDIVKDVVEETDFTGTKHCYIVMRSKPIQFYNDDLTDYKGNFNALPEDVARELFYAEWSTQFSTEEVK